MRARSSRPSQKREREQWDTQHQVVPSLKDLVASFALPLGGVHVRSPRLFQKRESEQWNTRHHVVPGLANVGLPKSQRSYFDHLPIVSKNSGELTDLLLAVAPGSLYGSDGHKETEDLVRKRYRQFPDYLRPLTSLALSSRSGTGFGDSRTSSLGEATAVCAPPAQICDLMTALDTKPSNEMPPVAKTTKPLKKSTTTAFSEMREKASQNLAAKRYSLMSSLDDSSAFPAFLQWAHSKHGHLVAVWRKLDVDGSMSLHKGEFLQGLRRLRYSGNGHRLWEFFDRDATGQISFVEFAPEAALQLAQFKRWIDRCFGGAKALMAALDDDHSGGVSMKEFICGTKSHGLPEELWPTISTIFVLLDDVDGSSKGLISAEKLRFLETWKPPTYWSVEPDMQAREAFTKALRMKNRGSMLLAWRKFLDIDASMKVSSEEFTSQCKTMLRKGLAEAVPQCGIDALYASFDQDRCGWFTLRDWCSETFEQLHSVVKFCETEHGSVKAFYSSAEATVNKTKGISWAKFWGALKPLNMPQDDARLLFHGLASKITGSEKDADLILEQDLQLLEKWDPARLSREATVWREIVHRSGVKLFGRLE